MNTIKQPTLKEAIEHLNKNGGHFEGSKGRVKYIGATTEDQIQVGTVLPTAEEIVNELCN